MSTVLHGARLIDGGTVTDGAWVRFTDARVDAVGTGDSWRAGPPAEAVDLAGAILSPGFVDIHGHGGAGFSYDEGVEAIRAARAMHRRHGTTSAVLSLVTAPLPALLPRVAMIADLAASDPSVLGAHLEGPFLDPEHRGAHDPAALIAPTVAGLDALLMAGRGTIRQITIAPDLPGGLEAIAHVGDAGVVAAVGHTGADAALTAGAFDAGATILTHAFNAMPGLHHRDPGPVGAALADDRVTLEVIADGVHLHPEVVRIAFAAAPGRIALVTDAMAAAGAADGPYLLGAMDVEVRRGVARLVGDGTIAGSTLTQDLALRTAVAAGVALPDALGALTSTPARAVAAPDAGHLRPGARADAVVLDAGLRVTAVWAGGARVV